MGDEADAAIASFGGKGLLGTTVAAEDRNGGQANIMFLEVGAAHLPLVRDEAVVHTTIHLIYQWSYTVLVVVKERVIMSQHDVDVSSCQPCLITNWRVGGGKGTRDL